MATQILLGWAMGINKHFKATGTMHIIVPNFLLFGEKSACGRDMIMANQQYRIDETPKVAKPCKTCLAIYNTQQQIRYQTMNKTYDEQTDVLLIRSTNDVVDTTEEVEPGILADYDCEGNVISLEIMRASKRYANPIQADITVLLVKYKM